MPEDVTNNSGLHLVTAAGIALAILIYVYLPAAHRLSDVHTELTRTITQAEKITSEVALLKAEKKALEEDPLYLEGVIRRDLRMVRAGEVLPPYPTN